MSVDVVLIAGPTASGKSAAALALAERLDASIVNADSMQVYRELRVLTARPEPQDEARAPHRLYGHVSATEPYSVGRYLDEAADVLAEVQSRRRAAIFVGGTGLYFDVLEKGLSPIPAVSTAVRETVRQKFEQLGREAFYADLVRRDPVSSAKLRPSDTQRLLRAADVLEATGKPLWHWQTMSGSPILAGLNVARFVIAPPQDVLHARIGSRFETMMRRGALQEARSLMGLNSDHPAARALGLRELWCHLKGETSVEIASAEAQRATRQYAKRQMTWFRNRMKDWKWREGADFRNFIT